MIRRVLQRIVRLSPSGARLAYSLVPEAVKRLAAPLLHPIAAGGRVRAGALPVDSPEPVTRIDVLYVSDGDGDYGREAERLAGGRRVIAVRPEDDLRAMARDLSIVDAIALCPPAHPRKSDFRRAGYRVVDVPPSSLDAAPLLRRAFPPVSIVVVTLDNAALCESCVNGIFRNTPWPSLDVIVVVNGSSGSVEAALSNDSLAARSLRVLSNADNLGYARATNQGLRLAKGDYVVLLNDDTVVGPGWLARLIAALELEPNLGLVCPVTNEIGNEARIETSYTTLSEMETLSVRRAVDMAARVRPTKALALFCAAARRSVLQDVDFLDERFEVGMFEDDDLCRKLSERGLRLGIVQGAFVHHVGQASFGKLSDDRYLSVWEANKRRYEQKWGTGWKPPA